MINVGRETGHIKITTYCIHNHDLDLRSRTVWEDIDSGNLERHPCHSYKSHHADMERSCRGQEL